MTVLRSQALALILVLVGCSSGGDGGSMGPPPGTELGSITTSVTTLNVVAGASASIGVTARDTDDEVIQNPGTPVFTSASPTIAEVDGQGSVLGLSAGSTVITVSLTIQGVTRTATVDVTVTGSLPVAAAVVAGSNDNVFTPDVVAVAQGGSVTWTFGFLEHTVNFSGSGAPTNIASGYAGSVSRTFSSSGTFNYVCTIHAGMSGKVIVR